jgi:hypothetical protein
MEIAGSVGIYIPARATVVGTGRGFKNLIAAILRVAASVSALHEAHEIQSASKGILDTQLT